MRSSPAWEIREGDALTLLRLIPDASIDCVVTSPPYWGLRDYGVDGQLGLESTPEEYVARIVEVFREVRGALRQDGTLWLVIGDCYATGAGRVGDHPGGGEEGARFRGDINRVRDDKRGYRGERLANGRGDQPAVLRQKTDGIDAHAGKIFATRSGRSDGKNTVGPQTQPNRMPIAGLKPKDLVGIPWRVAFALQADGWYLRSDIVWSKPNPMPESVRDRPTKSHEYIFLFTKSAQYFFDSEAFAEPARSAPHPRTVDSRPEPSGGLFSPHTGLRRDGLGRSGNKERKYREDHGGPKGSRKRQAHAVPWEGATRNRRTVWEISTKPFGGAHFAVFPPELPEICISAGCRRGGVVLDPFAGAGTTGVVACRLGRSFVGIELNPEYCALATARMAKAEGRVG